MTSKNKKLYFEYLEKLEEIKKKQSEILSKVERRKANKEIEEIKIKISKL